MAFITSRNIDTLNRMATLGKDFEALLAKKPFNLDINDTNLFREPQSSSYGR